MGRGGRGRGLKRKFLEIEIPISGEGLTHFGFVIRQRFGSWRAAAKFLGVGDMTLRLWAHGKQLPDLPNAVYIARELGVPVDSWVRLTVPSLEERKAAYLAERRREYTEGANRAAYSKMP